MAGSPVAAATEAVTENFGRFDPQNIDGLTALFDDLPEFYSALITANTNLAAKFGDELPVKPAVTEAIGEMNSYLAGLRDHATSLRELFEKAHKDELERLRNPRRNEEMWDVQNNR
jgi:hypothetical protein